MVIRVVIVQPVVHNSFDRNLERIDVLLGRAGREGPDFVVLPEAWEHSNVFVARNVLADRVDLVLDVLSRHAVEMNAVVVGGGVVVRRGASLMNSTPVVGPDGGLMGWQDKIHLYRSEKQFFTPGREIHVFRHRGIGFGVLICHDVAFPELGRIMALRGADLLLNPSRMPSPAIQPWHTYLESRCLENRVAAAAPNTYIASATGNSVIMQPVKVNGSIFQVRRKVLGGGEGLLASDLVFEDLRIARRERLAERIPSLYQPIVED
ncbi:MAG: carbon-nitrogen hydrolase family protein [Candidatus Caldarchaeum sp.]|nr:carbon-nitrogen hydrolase family protein [Candidatus Caldarchaeum sp.]MDW7977838.1 carbon-nitrogen hydrolase family protein [Candidatus Caldarchaeum sp.]